MLAAVADVLYIVDESGSDQNSHTQAWLATIVDDLAATLTAANIDARYGLVGFGESIATQNHRYAHSHLLGPMGQKDLFTTDVAHLVSAISNDLAEQGFQNSEDGWDTIEHAIAEYQFRESAVPILVLVQADEGRRVLNSTLTHAGILAALESKNIILNSVIAGPLLFDGQPPTQTVFEPLHVGADGLPLEPLPQIDWSPVFNLSSYSLSSDIYVLGVEADAADNSSDGQHTYYSIDTNSTNGTQQPTATTSQALQVSYNGSNTGATGMVGSGKSVLIGQNISGGIGPTLGLAA